MKKIKTVDEIISLVKEILRNSDPNHLLDSSIHVALCSFADAISKQQEIIDSLREQSKVTASTNGSHRKNYYYNGVHVGNIYYRVETFEGIKSQAEELKSAIEDRFNDFTSHLNFEPLFIVATKKDYQVGD